MPSILSGPDLNPSGICLCGCGKPTTVYAVSSARRGIFRGNHARFRPWHHLRIGPDYIIDPATGCWIWQRSTHHKWGYAQTKIKENGETRSVVVHRIFYERHIGPIPPGMQLDHLCKRRDCINPAHLEPVTAAINTRRSRVSKLTTEQVQEIRRLFSSGMSRRKITEMFPVTYAEVKHIINGRVWKGI